MQRRTFLELLAAGLITAATATVASQFLPRLLQGPDTFGIGKMGAPLSPVPEDTNVYPTAVPYLFATPQITKIPVPYGSISAFRDMPGVFALTVDDGISTEVVRAYTQFAAETGMRLTFFVTAQYSSWTDNIPLLRPLVESGQIQLANHTWSHPSLTSIGDSSIRSELGRTHEFLISNYGIEATPYFRPPYGNHDSRVDSIAASIGYSSPVMWYGSLSDAGQITPDQIRDFANKWIGDQRIVIGHANFPAVIECMDYIAQLILERKLQPVTLNDVFAKP